MTGSLARIAPGGRVEVGWASACVGRSLCSFVNVLLDRQMGRQAGIPIDTQIHKQTDRHVQKANHIDKEELNRQMGRHTALEKDQTNIHIESQVGKHANKGIAGQINSQRNRRQLKGERLKGKKKQTQVFRIFIKHVRVCVLNCFCTLISMFVGPSKPISSVQRVFGLNVYIQLILICHLLSLLVLFPDLISIGILLCVFLATKIYLYAYV